MKKVSILIYFLIGIIYPANAQVTPKPEDTEFYSPVPNIITPGKNSSQPPSDAIILFNGKNLNEWVSSNDTTMPAQWKIDKNMFTVNKRSGNIQTRRSFMDYQLHLEWMIPKIISGKGQARGNSGLFLASTGRDDAGYELQILDSYKNPTYVNGQSGSIYKQHIPLVNANKPPGTWQTYDVIWTAPRFNEDGSVKSPARVTAFFNGILIQNNVELKGSTVYIGPPSYKKHRPSPIKLQSHGDESEPICFRNIWIRPL
jgi:hypothetical protein